MFAMCLLTYAFVLTTLQVCCSRACPPFPCCQVGVHVLLLL